MIRYMFGNIHGTGSLLALTYTPGAPCLQRDNQLFAGLKKYPKVHMTRYELPGTMSRRPGKRLPPHSRVHRAVGNLAGWGCYDDPSVGALAAAKAMGRKDVSSTVTTAARLPYKRSRPRPSLPPFTSTRSQLGTPSSGWYRRS